MSLVNRAAKAVKYSVLKPDDVQAIRTAIDEWPAEQRELARSRSPVQRAQLVLAYTRLQQQIEQVMRRRMEGAGAGPRRQP